MLKQTTRRIAEKLKNGLKLVRTLSGQTTSSRGQHQIVDTGESVSGEIWQSNSAYDCADLDEASELQSERRCMQAEASESQSEQEMYTEMDYLRRSLAILSHEYFFEKARWMHERRELVQRFEMLTVELERRLAALADPPALAHEEESRSALEQEHCRALSSGKEDFYCTTPPRYLSHGSHGSFEDVEATSRSSLD